MDVDLEPMGKEHYSRFYERSIGRYAQENVRAGYRTEQEAERKSREDHRKLLPKGLKTPHTHLLVVRSRPGGEEIGTIWMREERGARHIGYIYDVFIEEGYRGQGHGKAAMRALEALARREGMVALYLHVFAHNPVAVHLYEGAGFQVKSMNMEKMLD